MSLDCNPFDVKRLFDKFELTISSVAAHAHLLDPTCPSRYGTSEIMKAIKLAGTLGIEHVHWKDLPMEMEADRGVKTGCGFSMTALGDGVIDIAGVYAELRDAEIAHSTLEIAGADNLIKSAAYLAKLEEQAAAAATA